MFKLKKIIVTAPEEFQSVVTGNINKRSGIIINSEVNQGWFNLQCEVPLNDMFGYCKIYLCFCFGLERNSLFLYT